MTEWHSQSYGVSKPSSNTGCVILGKSLALSASPEDETLPGRVGGNAVKDLMGPGVPMSSALTAPLPPGAGCILGGGLAP